MSRLIEEATERLSQRLRQDIVVIEVLAQIAERATFLTKLEGRYAVVKIDNAVCRGNREAIALLAAADAGLPVPELLLFDPDPAPIMVMSFAPGIGLEAASTVSPWIQAGSILRALHDLPAPAGLPKFDWFGDDWNDFLVSWSRDTIRGLRGKIALSNGLLTSLEKQMVGGFEALPDEPRVFLHGDCAFVHFILSPGGRRIRSLIDFGDAGIGDPLWDIATMVLWDPAMMNPVLKGYDAGIRLTFRAIATIRPYVILRHLTAVGWLLENDLDPTAHLNQLITYGLGT